MSTDFDAPLPDDAFERLRALVEDGLASGSAIPDTAEDWAELANVVLADDATTGLRQALAGQFASDEERDQALSTDEAHAGRSPD